MPYARMGSSGYQFPLLVVVQGILGHRAIARNLISVADLHKLMEALCDQLQLGGDYPSDSATRRWASKHPGLPEEALESDLISTDMLQRWARLMVISSNAQMGQDLATSGRTADDYDSTFGDLAKVVGGLYLAARFLNWLLSEPKSNGYSEERRAGSRIGRVTRRRGFKRLNLQ